MLSYLRKTLAESCYQVPDDPNLAPLQQDPKNDRFNRGMGLKRLSEDILEQVFPAICLPIFIQKFCQAQEAMLKNQQWTVLGNLKQILNGRIEMGWKKGLPFQWILTF